MASKSRVAKEIFSNGGGRRLLRTPVPQDSWQPAQTQTSPKALGKCSLRQNLKHNVSEGIERRYEQMGQSLGRCIEKYT